MTRSHKETKRLRVVVAAALALGLGAAAALAADDAMRTRQQDMKVLGTRIKAMNIAAMPLAVALAALGLSLWRMNRRRGWKRLTGDRS